MKVWKLRGLALAMVALVAACGTETTNNGGGGGTTDTTGGNDASGSDGAGGNDGSGQTDSTEQDAGTDTTGADTGSDTAVTDTAVTDTGETDTTVTDTTETDAGGSNSCEGRCGKYDAKASCQCDAYCEDEGDCCADYATLCADDDTVQTDASDTTDTGDDTTAPECTQNSDCKDSSKPVCDAGVCIPDLTDVIKGDALKAGDLFITEILADSTAVADDVGEWFEVKNNTAKSIDLRGLQIEDKNAKPHTIAGSAPVLLAAGDYAVLCANGDKTKNGGVDCDYTYGGAVKLTNSADQIKLGHAGGVVIVVSYQDGISNGGWPTILKGHAVQLAPGVTNTVDNADGNNWCVAQDAYGDGDFGTPGKANPPCGADADKDGFLDSADNCPDVSNPSQFDEDSDGIGNSCDNCPKVANKDQADADKDGVGDACPAPVCGDGNLGEGEQCDDGNKTNGDGCSADCKLEAAKLSKGDLVITELHIDPSAVSDDNGEFMEIYNTTDAEITLDGVIIERNGATHTIAPTSPLKVPAKGYVVLGKSTDTATNGGAKVDYAYGKDIALGNSGSELKIIAGGVEIDYVKYPGSGSGGWPKYKNGASIQLDPSKLDGASNDSGANWCESKTAMSGGDKGTPGKANEACQ
jgi:cysteine-rich repeat protein